MTRMPIDDVYERLQRMAEVATGEDKIALEVACNWAKVKALSAKPQARRASPKPLCACGRPAQYGNVWSGDEFYCDKCVPDDRVLTR